MLKISTENNEIKAKNKQRTEKAVVLCKNQQSSKFRGLRENEENTN